MIELFLPRTPSLGNLTCSSTSNNPWMGTSDIDIKVPSLPSRHRKALLQSAAQISFPGAIRLDRYCPQFALHKLFPTAETFTVCTELVCAVLSFLEAFKWHI